MSTVPSVVITTRLPPHICGIGTYSWLAHKNDPGDRSRAEFFVMDGASESRSALGWSAITDFNGDADRLLAELNRVGAANVVLHYAGRGYQRYGCPLWLPLVLRRWKSKFPSGHLTVFFHEVPGKIPRLSHHSILAAVSKGITRRIAAIADVLATNTGTHAAILREITDGADVHCLPVGSNVEPPDNLPKARIETEFVLFGLPFGRAQTLRTFAADIGAWQERGLLTKLHVIGPVDDKPAGMAPPVPAIHSPAVVPHGILADKAISHLLTSSRFALTNATGRTWSKSGTFMAFAAHGCAVVVEERELTSPLCHTIARQEVGRISDEEVSARASALNRWYEENATWQVTGRRLSELSRAPGAGV